MQRFGNEKMLAFIWGNSNALTGFECGIFLPRPCEIVWRRCSFFFDFEPNTAKRAHSEARRASGSELYRTISRAWAEEVGI